MRGILLISVQFVLFLVTFFVGSLVLHPFHVQSMLVSDATHTRIFVWDGLLLMLLLYLLVLLMEVAMKRLRGAAVGSTIAMLLAGALGLVMKFGFVTVDR